MEQQNKKRVAVIALIAAIGAFGGWQYAAATSIAISVAGSELVSENAAGSTYLITIAVDNPSLLPISVGETSFAVISEGSTVGNGTIEPFMLPVMGSTVAGGTYLVNAGASQSETVRISGSTAYDLLFASVSIPFEYDTSAL